MTGTRTLSLMHAVVAVTCLLAASACTRLESALAPEAELWQRWTASDSDSQATVDHGAWDRFLRTHVVTGVDGISRVPYAGVGHDDRAALDAYLGGLADIAVDRLRRPEQRAYWINLYNALTVKLLLDHYEVESIRDIDISPGPLAIGPWDRKLVTVAGTPISLNDIEHRILRPIWRDPRLHYALNCASLGCPNLQTIAFTAENTERLLEAGARAFIDHPRGARIEDRELVVSKIYAWFADDFGASEEAVIAHLARYLEPAKAALFSRHARIGRYEYDWRLNDAMR